MATDLELFEAHRSALVIVDMQNDFCDEGGTHARAGVVYYPPPATVAANIARLVAVARSSGALPVYVLTTHDETTDSPAWLHRKDAVGGPRSYACGTGTWGAESWRVIPNAQDVVVTKHRYSAFVGTNLDLILRSRAITSLAITGVATNVCVDCTLRDGLQADYHVALVSDATAATSEDDWGAAITSAASNYGPVCTTDEMIARWESSTRHSPVRMGEAAR